MLLITLMFFACIYKLDQTNLFRKTPEYLLILRFQLSFLPPGDEVKFASLH